MNINTYHSYNVTCPLLTIKEIQVDHKNKKETVQQCSSSHQYHQLAIRQEQIMKGRIIDIFA
jgi:hypothetical protein